MVRHASVLLAGVGMMLLGEATGNPLYDVLLQGGGMTLLAVVVVILLLKVLPGYHQAMKDVAETHAKALAEFRERLEAWEVGRREDSKQLNDTLMMMVQRILELRDSVNGSKGGQS